VHDKVVSMTLFIIGPKSNRLLVHFSRSEVEVQQDALAILPLEEAGGRLGVFVSASGFSAPAFWGFLSGSVTHDQSTASGIAGGPGPIEPILPSQCHTLMRRQFPLTPAYAMTFNSCH